MPEFIGSNIAFLVIMYLMVQVSGVSRSRREEEAAVDALRTHCVRQEILKKTKYLSVYGLGMGFIPLQDKSMRRSKSGARTGKITSSISSRNSVGLNKEISWLGEDLIERRPL